MDQISIYLEKFKNYGFKEIQQKELVIETIEELFDVKLERKNIKINNGEILISISGPLKSEIFIQKSKLIESIQNKLRGKLGGKIDEIKEVR